VAFSASCCSGGPGIIDEQLEVAIEEHAEADACVLDVGAALPRLVTGVTVLSVGIDRSADPAEPKSDRAAGYEVDVV
jgi:hypothetical protein